MHTCIARPIDFAPRLRSAAKAAFTAGHRAVNRQDLEAALEDRSQANVEAALDPGVTAFLKAFERPFRENIQAILVQAGTDTVKRLTGKVKVAGVKVLAPSKPKGNIDFGFDRTNPNVIDWINEHTAETLDDLGKATRDRIREIIERAFNQQEDLKSYAADLLDAIGDQARADVIARTESMLAANEGQAEAWDQAVDAGILTGNEKKTWIVTPDDRLCPICEAIDGQTVEMSDNFESPETGEQFDVPPAHPNCRCTVGLVG